MKFLQPNRGRLSGCRRIGIWEVSCKIGLNAEKVKLPDDFCFSVLRDSERGNWSKQGFPTVGLPCAYLSEYLVQSLDKAGRWPVVYFEAFYQY